MKWTKEQENAIRAHGGTVLVSAAAGSGKTAVLVERVIEMVCDSQNPCSLDRLLIVTFTKAAAAEMRDRIGAALAECLKKEPENRALLKQQILLPSAKICTMDSFCGSLVKEHYTLLDIAPDFRMLDDSERKAMEEDAVSQCIFELYHNHEEAFLDLSDLFLLGSSDRQLKDAILDLYHYAQAYPFPEEWLREIPKLYAADTEAKDTIWGESVFSHVQEIASDNLRTIQAVYKLLEDDAPLLEAYRPALSADAHSNETVLGFCEAKNWDGLKAELDNYKPERLKAAPKEYKDSLLKETAKSLRDSEKDALKKINGFIPATAEEYKTDCAILQPMVQLLVDAVLRFSTLLLTEKKQANAYDFNDIAHMALLLCVELQKDNTVQRTPLAIEIAKQYEEILLDEYQDTNEAQDMLFSSISDSEKNLFMVGDVKQSIYAFRRAMPDIFLNRRKNATQYNGTQYPARIDLNANFRSRKTVAEGINAVFSRIMSEKFGGVTYDANEQLNPCGDFGSTADFNLELHLVQKNDLDENGRLPEAVHIARTIREMIDSHMPITLKDHSQRPIECKDICILMRSTTSGEKYKEALEELGIPAYFQQKGGFFSMREISFMFSFLKILDNPYLDIPLCACLLSPVFGFTPDDLATLRLSDKGDSFFAKLQNCDDEKSKRFCREYQYFRQLSTSLTPSHLIRAIYEKTGYLSIVGALSGGENRKLNLRLFLHYAEEYEAKGKIGLAGFIRYLQKLENNESNVEAATGVSSAANVVRIMTIHKSKGLEFPVVILAKCGTGFNEQDQKKKMLLHNSMKIGLKVPDRKNHRLFLSVPYLGTKLALAREEKAEELRVLYVALTRAREKLIMVGSGSGKKSIESIVQKAALAMLYEDCVPTSYVRRSNSYLELLTAALFRHPNAEKLRDIANIPPLQCSKDKFPLKIVFASPDVSTSETESVLDVASTVTNEIDQSFLEELEARTSYQYERMPLSLCPAKASASSLNTETQNFEFFAKDKPAFLSKVGLTPSMRGVIMHRFAELCNFENAKKDLEAEIARLESAGFFSKEEADSLDRTALSAFVSSSLFARILQSNHVYREQKFTVFFPAHRIDSTIPAEFSNEEVLVQGILDCAFEEDGKIVIVDYKTDRERNVEKLISNYKKQLAVYKKAAKDVFQMEISETLLYSFYLKKEIPINI